MHLPDQPLPYQNLQALGAKTTPTPAAQRPYLIQSDDVRVAEQLHNLNFSEDLLEVLFIQLRLINDLYGNLKAAKRQTTRKRANLAAPSGEGESFHYSSPASLQAAHAQVSSQAGLDQTHNLLHFREVALFSNAAFPEIKNTVWHHYFTPAIAMCCGVLYFLYMTIAHEYV